MGSGIIGKIITFWIFILGALFAAKWMGIANNPEMLVKLLIVAALFFIGWMFLWNAGKKKNKAKHPQAPVSKGAGGNRQGAKKKKKK